MKIDFIEIVIELNAELYERYGETERIFSYTTNGFYDIISFDEIMLWNSEDDDRHFIEEIDDYEPFIPFIMRKFNNYIDDLNKLKFRIRRS